MYRSDYQRYIFRAEIKFNVRIENIKEIHAQNSGAEELSINKTVSKTPEQILADIDELAYKMDEFKNSSPEIRKIIVKTGFNTSKAKKQPTLSDYLDTINQ